MKKFSIVSLFVVATFVLALPVLHGNIRPRRKTSTPNVPSSSPRSAKCWHSNRDKERVRRLSLPGPTITPLSRMEIPGRFHRPIPFFSISLKHMPLFVLLENSSQ